MSWVSNQIQSTSEWKQKCTLLLIYFGNLGWCFRLSFLYPYSFYHSVSFLNHRKHNFVSNKSLGDHNPTLMKFSNVKRKWIFPMGYSLLWLSWEIRMILWLSFLLSTHYPSFASSFEPKLVVRFKSTYDRTPTLGKEIWELKKWQRCSKFLKGTSNKENEWKKKKKELQVGGIWLYHWYFGIQYRKERGAIYTPN